MNDELANFSSDSSSDSTQQRTNIEFINPTHPEQKATYTDSDSAQAYFDAATAAKDWPSNRLVLIGEFLLATQDLNDEGDSARMAEFVATLTGEEVSIGEVTSGEDDE